MTPSVRRDRANTEQRLIDGVGSVLARDGFDRLGVNTVARAAGVDKVLIYRYFGSLDGLLRAFGESGAFWPTDDELLGDDPSDLERLAPADRWALIVERAIAGIRARPLTREVLAWEIVERNELCAVLEEVRESQFERLSERYGADTPPAVLDAAVLAIAATNYLVARSRTIERFGGRELTDPGDWPSLVDSMIASVRRAAASSPGDDPSH